MKYMKPEYKYVDLVFENCNFVRIKPKDILTFHVSGVSSYFWTNCVSQFNEGTTCKKLSITLKNKAVENKTHFQRNSSNGENQSSFINHLNVYKDITHIFIKVNKKKEFYIGVPYSKSDNTCAPNEFLKIQHDKNDFTIAIEDK